MVAVRAYLDSEWAGADEYLDTVRMLIGFGMDDEAGSILSVYTDSCGRDTESLILRSVLAERSGDLMSALALASEASIRGKDSAKAKARVARVHLAMGDQVRAEKECAGLLAGGQDDPEALHIMMEIQARKGDNVSVISTCRKILDQDPGDVGTLIELARAQALTGDVAGASESAHRAVRADGSHGTYIRALSALLSGPVLVVGKTAKTTLPLCIDQPETIGADLIAAAEGALAQYAPPLVLIDMGTATTFSVLDKSGAFLGGAIAPGVQLGAEALTQRTGRLLIWQISRKKPM